MPKFYVMDIAQENQQDIIYLINISSDKLDQLTKLQYLLHQEAQFDLSVPSNDGLITQVTQNRQDEQVPYLDYVIQNLDPLSICVQWIQYDLWDHLVFIFPSLLSDRKSDFVCESCVINSSLSNKANYIFNAWPIGFKTIFCLKIYKSPKINIIKVAFIKLWEDI